MGQRLPDMGGTEKIKYSKTNQNETAVSDLVWGATTSLGTHAKVG